MERWTGRVALVTGASAGIGAAIVYQLQDHGVHVVAVARRVDKIQEAVDQARKEAKSRGRYVQPKVTPGKLYAKKCDVAQEEDILSVFKWIEETLGGVDILINNAGLSKIADFAETPTAFWKLQLDVNVLGLCIGTREAIKSMRARKVDDGHIIHIGSVLSHLVKRADEMMYSATKHAIYAITEGLRKDFVDHKSNMKITCISPGAVDTEFVDNIPQFQRFSEIAHLNSEDVADAVTYVLSTPPHVQIHEIIMKPIGELF